MSGEHFHYVQVGLCLALCDYWPKKTENKQILPHYLSLTPSDAITKYVLRLYRVWHRLPVLRT